MVSLIVTCQSPGQRQLAPLVLSEIKEIMISLTAIASFYIKRVQSVKGRGQSSLVHRALLQETYLNAAATVLVNLRVAHIW